MEHDTTLSTRRYWLLALISGIAAAVVSGCKTAPDLPASAPRASSRDTSPPVAGAADIHHGAPQVSSATTPRAYRRDGASHLYSLNAHRIYKGKMPPLLYAIGVLNIDIDRNGHVAKLDWMRAPKHAPEVIAEIERTVRKASPFPAPGKMGRVVYTDTWLWHSSGRFQLDTLTEGQT